MSIYIIKKSGHYYLLEKNHGKFINQISTGIPYVNNSKRIPKEVIEKKDEYIRNKEKLVKLKSKVLAQD
ncbi:MAG: hypothetical protein JST55_11015 [Bacteroidetes bacterium]|nr:hypothetical protein [Bacteroidota bacterium]